MSRIVVLLGVLLIHPLFALALSLGEQAPGWELNDLQGQRHRLEERRGQWVLLKLGTTECPNCTREIGELEKVEDDLDELGVQIFDIYLGEDRRRVDRYLSKHPSGLDRMVLYDPKGEAALSYGVSIIPQLFLVDPGGAVRWKATFTPADKLLKAVRDCVLTRAQP